MGFDYQKMTIVGRLPRDPETKSFQAAKVAKFGIACTGERKKNERDEWEDIPVYFDCEVWQREKGLKLADTVEKYCRKGTRVFLQGRLSTDEWTGPDGVRRSKLILVVERVQFLDARLEPAQVEGGTGRD